jgi:hypothetical protein
LQFNAYQWLNCVERIQADWNLIRTNSRRTLRYEDLIKAPAKKIKEIFDFLDLEGDKAFFESLPELKADNYNKWKTEFSEEKLKEIHPIITPQLMALGYAESEKWINAV